MRLGTLFAGLALALGSVVSAQAFETPKSLLEAFYKPYFTDDFAEDESIFRSEALNALYEVDEERTPVGEMGALGFDPYIDGQDYQLGNLVIGDADIEGDSATVIVSFLNFGMPTELVYDLVNEEGSWKIDDVANEGGEYPYRLSEIFEAAASGEY